MSDDQERLKNLTLDEIGGSISETDRQELNHLLKKSSKARELHRELVEKLGPPAESMAKNITPENVWNRITLLDNRRERVRKYIRHSAIAVVTLILLSIPIMQKWPKERDSLSSLHVVLQFSGGRVINLDSIPAQGFQLHGYSIVKRADRIILQHSNNVSQERVSLRVPAGRNYSVVLPDGTGISMNAMSTLAFGGDTRHLNISGEAFFSVKKNVEHPLMITLPDNNRITVLGTIFNINTYSGVKVMLLQGSIKLITRRDSVILKQNQGVTYNQDEILKLTGFNPDELLWTFGLYKFENATIEEIGSIIYRCYGIKVVIDKRSSKTKEFRGIINKNLSLCENLSAFELTGAVQAYIDNNNALHLQ